MGKRARLWSKTSIEKESNVLGDVDPSSVLPADFIIPFETAYRETPPPSMKIEVKTLRLRAPFDSPQTTPNNEEAPTSLSEASNNKPSEIHGYSAAISFTVTENGSEEKKGYVYSLSHDVYFVTAHPCHPSQHIKILKSPSSPTIQQVDLSGSGQAGKTASTVGK